MMNYINIWGSLVRFKVVIAFQVVVAAKATCILTGSRIESGKTGWGLWLDPWVEPGKAGVER